MRNTRFVKIAALFVLAFNAAAVGQGQKETRAVLSLTSSKNVVGSDETIILEIALKNISQGAFYTCGTVNVSLLRPLCTYSLQVRPVGSTQFETIGGVSGDVLDRPYGSPPSPDRFKSEENIFLMQPGHFIGVKLTGTWDGLTVKPPGQYEVRVVYSARGPVPITLDKPYLVSIISSNVLPMEVKP